MNVHPSRDDGMMGGAISPRWPPVAARPPT